MKSWWLQNPDNMGHPHWRDFSLLRKSRLEVTHAWAINEPAMRFWGFATRGWAEWMWQRWYGWAIRSRLEPFKRVARRINSHWEGVISAAISNISNPRDEGINSKVQ